MRHKAFLLIETEVNRTREAIKALKQLEQVKSVDPVTGKYDVIAVIEGENLADIGDLVTSKVHALPHVSKSTTCISLAWS